MTALALLIGRIPDGWAVYLSNGVELARYRGRDVSGTFVCTSKTSARATAPS